MSNTLRPQEAGVVPSGKPSGWLAERWLANLKGADAVRMARGRTWAKGGRVRELEVSPGQAHASVMDGGEAREVTVRVQSWDAARWRQLVDLLRTRLAWVAALLEGELPQGLVESLDGSGLRLFPGKKELDGSCECDDWVSPCPHVAAVHAVLADALDGDPLLLVTLRGLTRDRFLGDLHAAWGSDRQDAGREPVEKPADRDWYRSPNPSALARFEVCFAPPSTMAAGLKALGSPPGGPDLVRGLSPLYEAGGRAARELALQEAPRAVGRTPTPISHGALPVDEPDADEDDAIESEDGLTELLVDRLADAPGARSQDLADRLALPVLRVRQELVELERLGIVYRTGNTRGTRWWLG